MSRLIAEAKREAKKRASTMPRVLNLDLLQWTQRYRRELIPDRYFDLENHSYLADIYNDKSQEIALYKSGQVGISEYLLSYALHACDQRAATALYVFPKDNLVSDFSAARLGPAIEASKHLQSIIVEGAAASGKKGADRVTLKRVRNRFLYMRGGTVSPDGKASQLKSIDADLFIVDEVDECDPRVPGLLDKRLGHSTIKEKRFASTPSYHDRGIHAFWKNSTQNLWIVLCQSCGNRQDLAMSDVILDFDELGRPVAWHGMSENRAYVACRKCGAEINRHQSGEWVPQEPSASMTGYHVTKLLSPSVDLLPIVAGLSTTDESDLKECLNQDWGLPYRPRGGGMTDETLDACKRDYAHGPTSFGKCYMGVDVGKVLNVVIRSAPDGETGERRQLLAVEVPNFDDVGRLIDQYQPESVVIDALPETRKCRELQSDFEDGYVWLAYYTETDKKSEPARWNTEEYTVTIDRTRMLDETFSRFVSRRDGSQVNTIPASTDPAGSYYGHMKAPVRVVEKKRDGTMIARYVEDSADHYAHAENYCTAAAMAPVITGSAGVFESW